MITEQHALLAAIRANPDDRTTRLVYADWLDEHDDPLGGYVRIEVEVSILSPGGPEWQAAVGRLRDLCANANRSLGGWEYATDLDRIREKIDRLRTLDNGVEVFGARWGTSGHEYQLNPPLREADLLAFELRHGLMLPAEYRAFLLRVGNGRVGPGYGLIPLALATDLPQLRKPFGITPAEADVIVAAVRDARHTRNWRGVPKFQRAWSERGYHCLSNNGCGNYSVIVVNGPLSGEIWALGDWLTPHRDRDGWPEGFLAWYERWLDEWLAPGAIDRWASHFRR